MRPVAVVVGGGYAGLSALARLQENSEIDLYLVDPNPSHQLIPELPEALEASGSVARHVVSFQKLLDPVRVQHIAVSAKGLSATRQAVHLANGADIKFDWCVLAPGSEPALPPLPGLEREAFPLRDARDTARIKRELQAKPRQAVVVVGGGLTGVEVAGVLAPAHDVTLVEGAARLLPGLGPGLAQYAFRQLQTAGVRFFLQQSVTSVNAQAVRLTGTSVPFDVLIWAGGIRPPEWLANTDLPLRQGYPQVDREGRVVDRVYAAGDIWRVTVNGQAVPQTAQVAQMAGEYVARQILRHIAGQAPLPPFLPRLKGMLVSLEPGQGIGWVLSGGIFVQGRGANWLKRLTFLQHRWKLASDFARP